MRCPSLILVLLLMTGCAASTTTEVKQASSEVNAALTTLRAAQKDFGAVYLTELEETRLLIGRAIVADAVVRTVNKLAEQERSGNLIAISRQIKAERDAYRRLVNLIMNEPIQAGDSTASIVVDRVLKRQASALRVSATILESEGKAAEALRLQARAEQLGELAIEQKDDMLALVELGMTKNVVRQGLQELDNYLAFLNIIQAQVHEWVSTDVKVRGNEVARLIETHQHLLGSNDRQGGQR